MKQVLIKKGNVIVEDVPAPQVNENSVLVRVAYSSISTGTEVSMLSSSGESLIQKALKDPQKIKKVFSAFKSQGLTSTATRIRQKSEDAMQVGYSAAGTVLQAGKNISTFSTGDRVACAGAGIANHAEYIVVPENLLVHIPEGVSFAEASTVSIGAIALQGVRRAHLSLGEYGAVIGLGVIGQLTVQLLQANGIRTIGIDVDQARINNALDLGLDRGINPAKEDIISKVISLTNGFGVDAALIATATSSSEPLSQAFQMTRKKGRVVLVGVTGMHINREDMYRKELDFFISTSYGPGRYDDQYELKGVHYPYAYVRWTEKRNMEEYLRLIADKKLTIKPLIEREYSIDEAPKAFEELQTAKKKPLLVLLKYNQETKDTLVRRIDISPQPKCKDGRIRLAIVGGGNFARNMHLPNIVNLKDTYTLHAVASRTASNATSIAQKYSAGYATTDYSEILKDNNIDAVIIATRHNLHVPMAIQALKAGKAVFLEKPMALNKEELDTLVETIEDTQLPFMVGFNRRFSPYVREAQKHTDERVNPLIINYRMNAGYIPLDNWVHTDEGGGRIIGEACHLFDLFTFFTNAEVEAITANRIKPASEHISPRDNVVVTLKYKDGSLCTLTYTSLGTNDYPKESCEIFFDSKVITMDDYKMINGYGVTIKKIRSRMSDKGQYEELVAFARYVKGETISPIPLWQLIQATEISFVADNGLQT